MIRYRVIRQLPLASLLLGCLLASTALLAVEKVRVMALFADKAMLQIDGQQRLLRAGQRSPEGVLLVSADANGAVIEMDGRRERYGLGSQVGGNFAQRQMAEVKIWADTKGSYNTVGSINGRMVDMLVDTGATSVAMSETEAKRLGIPYRIKGEKTGVRTASGFARAYAVTLDQVQVGELTLQQVEAVVVEGNSPHRVLLGMSFLGRVNMQHKGSLMVLQSKF
ncbi:retropepsin-like aspartic protease family protein [Sedimenticola hydrogenitrophicus]|uniref:retropepsin-like aspartic protease family protein n=1 Tax=Sedimenticola hydrogenitrophicus TaxID=2967975 RepID=UPI0021A7CA4B|nr:TIGR02281 family clan AA aspartic protease [Sedimenticola hydrogenitrophicus]